jgi:hypothetical protein
MNVKTPLFIEHILGFSLFLCFSIFWTSNGSKQIEVDVTYVWTIRMHHITKVSRYRST